MNLPPRLRAAAPWLLGGLLAGPLAGCSGDGAGGAAGGAATVAAPGAARSYEVRGVVTRVADPPPATRLVIRHEAIDDFVGIDGATVGMDSMSMEFPLAPGLPVAGIVAGDRVAFTLEVTWDGDPPYRIVHLEELPATAELEFRKARGAQPLGGGASPAEPAQDDAPDAGSEETRDAETQG